MDSSVLFVAIGFVAHVIKKNWSDKVNWKRHLLENKERTIMSIGATLSTIVASAAFYPDASIIEYIGIGYIIDSAVNKSPRNDEDHNTITTINKLTEATSELAKKLDNDNV